MHRLPLALRPPRFLTHHSHAPFFVSSRPLHLNRVINTRRAFTAGSARSHFGPLSILSQEEIMLQDTVSKFSKEKVAPKVSEMDEKGELDASVLRDLFEAGFMGVEVPERYGGGEMSFFQSCLLIEGLAKVDPAISVIVDIQNTLANTIMMKFGTEVQKEKYLPRMVSDTLVSFCLSEASSGSDAFAMKTTAKLKGENFIISGSKMWISNAKEAGLFFIFANADPAAGYKGITAFIAEAGTPGLKIGKKENKLGIRASSTCEVHFEDVELPKENILGEIGQGYKIAIGALNEGRVGIGAQMVGFAQGAFDASLPYMNQRRQFGKPISTFQGMEHQYAQARTDIEAARLLVYNAARLKDAGLPCIQVP